MSKSAIVKRETASQRRHFRLTAPLRIRIGSQKSSATFQTKDWSVGGFCLKGYNGSIANDRKEAEILAQVEIPFSDFKINFLTKIKLIRINTDKQEMAAEFIELDNRQQELLKYFADCLISGEMALVEETLKHIDTPVTLVSEKPDSVPKGADKPYRKHNRTYLISAAYVAAGLVVAAYMFSSIYSGIFKVQVESATISAPDSIVKSPLSGTIHRFYVGVGDVVSRDEPLFYIRDDATIESIELAKIKVRDASALAREKEQTLVAQYELLESYRIFGLAELDIAKARANAIKDRLSIAETRYQRVSKLNNDGLSSDDLLDRASVEVIELKGSLAVALAEERIAKRAVDEISNGRFYTDNKLEGKVAELKSAVVAAKERVELEHARLALMEKRRLRLEIMSPDDGQVVSIFSGAEQLVEKGEPLLVIEGNGEKQVEALLSAKDIERVDLEKPAKVFVDGSSETLIARVTSVERGLPVADQNTGVESSRNISSPVKIKLSFISNESSSEFTEKLPAGLPVTVEFSRSLLSRDKKNTMSQISLINSERTKNQKLISSTIGLSDPVYSSP